MIFVIIIVVAIAWGLIVLVHKANVAFGGEEAAKEGTTIGGCITFLIVIAAIAVLCYFWDVLGGSYDTSTPFRR